MDDAAPKPSGAMRCMEIRGGSHAVEEALETPGLEGWVYSAPFEGADSGGDLYYVSLCGGGVITRLIVADISGHGVTVSQFSAMFRDLMRKNINTKSQTGLVRALNRQFGAMAQTRRFATAIVATYLATRRSLTVCNAGHPRPLWYRAARQEWRLMDRDVAPAGNLPLGIDSDSLYQQFSVILAEGDLVLFYTDALIEAADADGQLLGEQGLLDLARGLEPTASRAVGPALLSAVERHRGGRPANDDVTLVTLTHTGKGPRRPSVAEKLDVYAKVFRLRDY